MQAVEFGALAADLERAVEDALAAYSLEKEDDTVARAAAKMVLQFLVEEGYIEYEN